MKRLFVLIMVITIYFMAGLFTDVFAQRNRSAMIRFYETYILRDLRSGTFDGLDTLTIDALTITGTINDVKVYRALLSQNGTSPPTAVVLENTLGGTVVWTYTTTGQYRGTLTDAFPQNKTFCIMGNAIGFNGATVFRGAGFRANSNSVIVLTHSEGAFVNGALGASAYINGEFEIIVYP